jgi:hypothetical protein
MPSTQLSDSGIVRTAPPGTYYEIAEYLGREVLEVEAKIEEQLG